LGRYGTPRPRAPVWLDHPSSLEHDTGRHPEQPARIIAIERELAQHDWFGFERVRSPAVEPAVLEAVHPHAYVAAIERACANGGGHLDIDTVVSTGSYEAALHAAGGAVRMVDLLLSGEAPYGFSAHRPPGHHALRARAMGFCLFNSIAVAAQHALDAGGLERVMIFDWDVHHGNGTNDFFHASDRVLFVSIHQSPLYPGTGPASDVGSGAGRGFTVNLPVGPGADDELFGALVDHVVVPLARSYEPQLMLVSAGYDAHRDEPLAQCEMTEQGFAAITRSIHTVCESLQVPIGCVLEGGYALGALGRSVAATLAALNEPVPPDPPDPGPGEDFPPPIRQVRARLAESWPSLA
jgi:acetoin utilization deacetylase AcuC-like enzyme